MKTIIITVTEEITSREIRFPDNRQVHFSLSPGRQLSIIQDIGDEVLVTINKDNPKANAWIPKNKVRFPEL